MNFEDNKLEFGIGALAVVLIAGLFHAFSGFGSHPHAEAQEISYEMPRPKSDLVGEFSLGDREIERREILLKKQAEAEEKKKAEEVKAKAVAKAAVEAAKKAAVQKSPQTKINVVQRDDKHMTQDQRLSAPTTVNSAFNNQARQTAATQDGNTDKKATLTPGQWLALLISAPTQDNMSKLVEALHSGEISDDGFYGIVDHMLKSNNAKEQTVAFFGLSQDMDIQSFDFMVKEESSLTSSQQTVTEQYLNSFASVNRGALAAAVQSSDLTVALKAAQVVLAGVEAAGSSAQGSSNSSGGVHTTSLSDWSNFIPIFQHLSQQAGNANLQSISNNILTLLGSSVGRTA